jgi:type IV secretory pathway TrbD component
MCGVLYLRLFLQGWYIITYALGIYYLNLLLAFLSPKIDPSYGMTDDDDDEDSGELLW